MKTSLRLLFAMLVVVVVLFARLNRRESIDLKTPAAKPVAVTVPSVTAHAKPVAHAESSNLSALVSFKAALQGTDQAQMKLAFQQLANFLAQNPDKMSEALSALKSDKNYPQVFYWMSQWNAENPTSAGSDLIKTWTSQLAQEDHSKEGQQAALGLLAHTSPDANLLSTISQVYRDAANNDVQIGAIVTLKDWATKNPALQSAVQDRLVEIVNSASDEEVRERAFEAVANVGLSDATLANATQLLWKEPTDANRSLLAQAFENAAQNVRASALAQLQQAGTEANDPAVERAVLAQIVRIGKRDAVDTIHRLAAAHPELQQDANDYLRILQEGASDIATIDRKKLEAEAQLAEAAHNVP